MIYAKGLTKQHKKIAIHCYKISPLKDYVPKDIKDWKAVRMEISCRREKYFK